MFKLGRIADVAAKRHGWSPDRVQNAENEYRKFLYLLMLRPEEMLVPWHDDLDLFWHEHILHTEQYAVDCRHLFGRFIHHDPSISNRPIEGAGARLDTAWAYYRTFGRRAKAGSDSGIRLLSPARPLFPNCRQCQVRSVWRLRANNRHRTLGLK